MRRLFKPLLFLFFAAMAISCSKDDAPVQEQVDEGKRPFVDFDIIQGDDPFTFKFDNKSENYKSLKWRFGDDSLSTDSLPDHIYMTTGTFEVNLEATSETGATAKKLLVININPDSVVKVSAPKTGKTGEVKFNIVPPANTKSVLWTFEDNSTSTELAPVKTYTDGSLNTVNLKVTSDKGSVTELNKFVSTEGILTDITRTSALSVSADNAGGPTANEGSLKIIDNDLATKLYMGWPGSYWTQFEFPSAQTIKFYGIGTANDWGTRLAKDWTLQGSNDGTNWEVIDTRAGITPGEVYGKMFYYAIANPKPFRFYKWNVTANNGDGGWQLSEFKLYK